MMCMLQHRDSVKTGKTCLLISLYLSLMFVLFLSTLMCLSLFDVSKCFLLSYFYLFINVLYIHLYSRQGFSFYSPFCFSIINLLLLSLFAIYICYICVCIILLLSFFSLFLLTVYVQYFLYRVSRDKTWSWSQSFSMQYPNRCHATNWNKKRLSFKLTKYTVYPK